MSPYRCAHGNVDELDERVVCQLGYSVARAQLFEHALIKLREAQQHDLTLPLDERWDEISVWLKQPAGLLADELKVTPSVASDLQALVKRRNDVVHRGWTNYKAAREHGQGDAGAPNWERWLSEQAEMLGRAYNGLMTMTERVREQGREEVAPAQLDEVWRAHVPEAIERP